MGAWSFVDRKIECTLGAIGHRCAGRAMSAATPRPARRPVWRRCTPRSRPPWSRALQAGLTPFAVMPGRDFGLAGLRAAGGHRDGKERGKAMSADIKVPTLGESVTTATVARWLKKAGEAVAADEPLVELETDKVTVEVNAPSAGTLGALVADEGAEVEVGALLGTIEEGAGAASPAKPPSTPASASSPAKPPPPEPAAAPGRQRDAAAPRRSARSPARHAAGACRESRADAVRRQADGGERADRRADRRRHRQGRRITKGDVLAFLSRPAAARPLRPRRPPRAGPVRRPAREERVKMTRLRRTIAARLKEAQNNAAMLTTFNEVDMSAAMALRTEYRDAFREEAWRHPPRLHGLLRARLRVGAGGVPGGQRRDRRRRDRLQALRPHGHRRGRAERPGGAGGARRRPDEPRADRGGDRQLRPPRARRRN